MSEFRGPRKLHELLPKVSVERTFIGRGAGGKWCALYTWLEPITGEFRIVYAFANSREGVEAQAELEIAAAAARDMTR